LPAIRSSSDVLNHGHGHGQHGRGRSERLEKSGFKAVEYPRIELTVDQIQNLGATLAPGGVPQKVTVTESVAPVDLNDAQIGGVVTGQQIADLPLILRDPYQLILLSPGAIQSNSLLAGLSVNGSRERNNNFLMNGTDNNDAEIPGLTLPQPGADLSQSGCRAGISRHHEQLSPRIRSQYRGDS